MVIGESLPEPADKSIAGEGERAYIRRSDNHNLEQLPHALRSCESLDHGGRTDWRLPNILELRSLVDSSRTVPAIHPDVFPSGPAFASFWSSTTNDGAPTQAFQVVFDDGNVFVLAKDVLRYARCVVSAGTP